LFFPGAFQLQRAIPGICNLITTGAVQRMETGYKKESNKRGEYLIFGIFVLAGITGFFVIPAF